VLLPISRDQLLFAPGAEVADVLAFGLSEMGRYLPVRIVNESALRLLILVLDREDPVCGSRIPLSLRKSLEGFALEPKLYFINPGRLAPPKQFFPIKTVSSFSAHLGQLSALSQESASISYRANCSIFV
jgi:hypothetical protein